MIASFSTRLVAALCFAVSVGVVGCGAEPVAAAASAVSPAPTVAFTAPVDGSLVRGSIVRVSGTAAHTTELRVNGQVVPVQSGTFTLELPFQDGPVEVTAEATGPGGVSRATAVFEVDGTPPALALATPGRATSLPTAPGALQTPVGVSFSAFDERGLTAVTLTGSDTSADAAGGGSVELKVPPGLSLLRATATDAAGNLARETVAVLAGDFRPATELLPDAVVVHVGPAAFAAIARAAEQVVDDLDVEAFALAKNPFVDSGTVRLEVTAASLNAPTEVAFSLAQDGLSLTAALNGVHLAVAAKVTVATEPALFEIDIQVPRLAATVPVRITTDTSLEPPVFDVTLLPPTFDIVDPIVTVTAQDGTPVPDTGFIQGEVLATLETLVSSLVTQYGQEPLRVATAALTSPIEVPFGGAPIVVDLEAIEATVATTGLDLRLGGVVFIDGASAVPVDPGVYRTPTSPALALTSDDLAFALSDDLVNTVLHEAWRRGALDYRVDQSLLDGAKAELDLVAGFLGGLTDLLGDSVNPEAPLGLDLGASLPPIMQPGGSGLVTLGLGDATLGFVVGSAPGGPLPVEPLGSGYVSVFLAVGVEARGEEVALTLDLVESAFDLDLTDPKAKRTAEADIEPFVEAFLGELGPLLGSLLAPFKLPAIAGFQPYGVSVGDEGTAGGFLVVHALIRPAD